MVNRYLLAVYRNAYNENFDYDSFFSRLKLQKAVYLLQEMGVPIGDYGFSWYKHGPYSQALQDDAYIASKDPSLSSLELTTFSEDNREALDKLKAQMQLPSNADYDTAKWSECIASIHFIRQNILSRNSTDEEILKALTDRKPHMNNAALNALALTQVKALFD